MYEVNSKGIQQIVNSIQSFISHVEFTLNGLNRAQPIWKFEPKEQYIRILIFVDGAETGTITKVALIDFDGDVVDEKVDLYEVDEKGRIIAFDYQIQVKG